MRHRSLITTGITAILSLSGGAPARSETIEKDLHALSPAVYSDAQRQGANEMIWLRLKSRLQESNRASSDAWSAIRSQADWEAFVAPRLAKLEASLGAPFPRDVAPLHARVTGEAMGDGYRVQNVLYQSRPGLWITANLYTPAKPGSAMPGLILCHSHHRPKEHSELQDMGMTWARHGCAVLVPDHLGHGERRQHPFATESDFPREFPVSRQDYHFRYDTSIQLYLAGESLMGWMVWDLRRGVDFLVSQTGVDPEKIILLGAVAGGGDPAAVAAALDSRIAAAVPFNFGGPQPETRFPLPEDVETTFNYAGGGSWESTRNLHRSAGDGFLPWVIVGGIAPRRLIFAHEFTWDRPRDPVWKRLQSIYELYGAPDHLAYTHGKGELRGLAPEASHCTHIGKFHRRLIHEALGKWFGISATTDTEYSAPRDATDLRCVTSALEKESIPGRLIDLLPAWVDARRVRDRTLADILGTVSPPHPAPQKSQSVREKLSSGIEIERYTIESESGIVIPVMLARPADAKEGPVAIGVAQQGRAGFLEHRSAEIAGLLKRGIAVCLPDLRGCGEAGQESDRGQRSGATSYSATALMLGDTMTAARLRDLRAVIATLGDSPLAIWGESFTEPNPADATIAMPRTIDGRPRQSEPLGATLALIAPLFEPKIRAVSADGGIATYRSVLTSQFVLIPHDAVIPGLLSVADLPEIAAKLAVPVRVGGMVDESNRLLPDEKIRQLYPKASHADLPVADWIADALAGR